MKTIYFYNTQSREKCEFVPLDPSRVTMYVCGPTVYSHPHIGNARPAVVFDVLNRLLRHHYPNVVYARNITDIDDKINAAAAAQGVDISVITDEFTAVYHNDMKALGVLMPDIEPHATTHIPQMIAMIEQLVELGFAYAAQGHVLFHVPADKAYGQLSGRDLEDMIAGARVEVAPYKKHPADFVLWKPSGDEQPGWSSPWGRGRPGWHLECSAMIKEHLGETIDIHGGGHDLIFPHHENEVAQSTCAHGGKEFVRYWLHNGFVNVDAEKMSKSLGNVLLVDDLLQEHRGETVRLVLLSTHYRKPMDWNDEVASQAKRNLDRFYGALRDHSEVEISHSNPDPKVVEALNDDLNTPQALAECYRLLRQLNAATDNKQISTLKSSLIASAALLGLLSQEPQSWFQQQENNSSDIAVEQIESLMAERQQARANKDFALSDKIRDQLAEKGIVIEDAADGARWKRGDA